MIDSCLGWPVNFNQAHQANTIISRQISRSNTDCAMRRSSGHHIGTNFSEGRNCFFKQPLSSNFLTQSNPSREKGELEHDPQRSNKLLSTRAVTFFWNVCADIVSSRRVQSSHLIAYSKVYTRRSGRSNDGGWRRMVLLREYQPFNVRRQILALRLKIRKLFPQSTTPTRDTRLMCATMSFSLSARLRKCFESRDKCPAHPYSRLWG